MIQDRIPPAASLEQVMMLLLLLRTKKEEGDDDESMTMKLMIMKVMIVQVMMWKMNEADESDDAGLYEADFSLRRTLRRSFRG